jgi:hypothetical protein
LHRLLIILTVHEAIFKDFLLPAQPEGKGWIVRSFQFVIYHFFPGFTGYAGPFFKTFIFQRSSTYGTSSLGILIRWGHEPVEIWLILPDNKLWTCPSPDSHLYHDHNFHII